MLRDHDEMRQVKRKLQRYLIVVIDTPVIAYHEPSRGSRSRAMGKHIEETWRSRHGHLGESGGLISK